MKRLLLVVLVAGAAAACGPPKKQTPIEEIPKLTKLADVMDNQATVTGLDSGTTDAPFLWRFGWTAGAGMEFPVAPHWTASIEYLFTHYGHTSVFFPNAGQAFGASHS